MAPSPSCSVRALVIATLALSCSPRSGGDGEPIQIEPAEATLETAGEPKSVQLFARTAPATT